MYLDINYKQILHFLFLNFRYDGFCQGANMQERIESVAKNYKGAVRPGANNGKNEKMKCLCVNLPTLLLSLH